MNINLRKQEMRPVYLWDTRKDKVVKKFKCTIPEMCAVNAGYIANMSDLRLSLFAK